MKRLWDTLAPRGDTVQIFLKKKGEPVAAIYKDDKVEVRSPVLDGTGEGHDTAKHS